MNTKKCIGRATIFTTWYLDVILDLLHLGELIEYKAILILSLSVFSTTNLYPSLANFIDTANHEYLVEHVYHLSE